MILNAKNNNFRIELPRSFFSDYITNKYIPSIKKYQTIYNNIWDFINASIQSCTVPTPNLPIVEQERLHNTKSIYKGKGNVNYYLDKDFTITFKFYDGFLNYFIMYELLIEFYEYRNKNTNLGDLLLTFYNNSGYEIFNIVYEKIVYNSISELKLEYPSNTPTFQTFDCGFSFNDIKFNPLV